jgi:hypothetical protein
MPTPTFEDEALRLANQLCGLRSAKKKACRDGIMSPRSLRAALARADERFKDQLFELRKRYNHD